MTQTLTPKYPWLTRAAAGLCALFMAATLYTPARAEDAWMADVSVEEGVALTQEEAAAAVYDAFEAEEDKAFFMGKVTDLRTVFDLQDKSWEGLAAFTWEFQVPDAKEITLHFGAVQLTGASDKIVLENLKGERTAYTGSELDHQTVAIAGEALSLTLYLEQNRSFTAVLDAVYSDNHNGLHVVTEPQETEGIATLTLRQVTGRPIQQVTYTLQDEAGAVVEQVTSADLTYSKADLSAGHYTVSAQVTDGVHAVEVGTQAMDIRDAAAKIDPFTLVSLGTVPDLRTGEFGQAAFRAVSPLSGQVYYYVFRLLDVNGKTVSETVSNTPIYNFQTPYDGVFAIQANAFDGWSFAIVYTNWFRSRPPVQLAVSLQVNAGYNGGSKVVIRPTALKGGPVRYMTVILLNSQYQHVQRWDFAGSQAELIMPNVTGTFAFWVYASDTVTNASAGSNWFYVKKSKVEQEVTRVTAKAQAGLPITFQVNTIAGDVNWTMIRVRKPDGTILASTTSAERNPAYMWTPSAAGKYNLEVVAYDGVAFEGNYLSFDVTAKPVYRALFLGMGYTGSSNALPGTLNDARTAQTALSGLLTLTSQRRLEEGTYAQIQSAITTAFAGQTANDISIFYYSGHGSSSGALVTKDNYGISPATLRLWLDKIPGTKIVIVDACHSGKIIGKSVQPEGTPSDFVSSFTAAFSASAKSLNANGYYVMTAAHSSELSYEVGIYSGGVSASVGAFTHCLLKGIGYDNVAKRFIPKAANTNQDEWVTITEAFNYARTNALDITAFFPNVQTAQYYFTDPTLGFIKN